MLPCAPAGAAESGKSPWMYADRGIPMLFHEAYEHGAQKNRIRISAAGGAFHDPAADTALFSSFKEKVSPNVRVVEMDNTINDEVFAHACAHELLENLGRHAAPN